MSFSSECKDRNGMFCLHAVKWCSQWPLLWRVCAKTCKKCGAYIYFGIADYVTASPLEEGTRVFSVSERAVGWGINFTIPTPGQCIVFLKNWLHDGV